MSDRSRPGFIERMAKSNFLLPLGYKEFPENPQSRDWRALIIGLSLVPAMLLAGAFWLGVSGSDGVGITVAVALVFTVVWVLPKIILWLRLRGGRDAGKARD